MARLGSRLHDEDNGGAAECCHVPMDARHNNGFIRDKILTLDKSIGVLTDSWWLLQSG